MNRTPSFDLSLLPFQNKEKNIELWHQAVEKYEIGEYYEAIDKILLYIKPDLILQNIPCTYEFAHGSICMYVSILEDRYIFDAPFLEINDIHKIPIMRQVAEINFSNLNLANIFLTHNALHFRYEAPIKLSAPSKFFAVFEEICLKADNYDDIFIEKFKAKRISKSIITQYEEDLLQKSWEKFNFYIQETDEYIRFFTSKKIEKFAWDALYLGFSRMQYVLQPQGFLKAEIEKGIRILTNSEENSATRVFKAKKIFESIKLWTPQMLKDNLYHIQELVDTKVKKDIESVQNYIRDSYYTAQEEMAQKDYVGATLTVLCSFYGLLAFHRLPNEIMEIITSALKDTSQQKWTMSATRLFDASNQILNMKIER
jgi:6-pyruvoyl-tetrahydropterin synthase